MQKSFWWWQCSDRYIISLSPHLHTSCSPFSPSLISLMFLWTLSTMFTLTGCGDARRLWSNKGIFQVFALVWQTAQNGRLHKTGGINLLSELHVPHKQCLTGISNAFSASFTSTWPSFPRFHSMANKSVPTMSYTRRHLLSAVPWISEDRLLLCHKAQGNERCSRNVS